jgi:hypothetical protein
VEDQELRWSRRLLGVLLVTLEPPPPLLRQRLDQQGSFEATGLQETMPKPFPRGEHLNPEEPTISKLGAEALVPLNPPINDLSVPLLIQDSPPRVTHHERQIVLQVAMEENVATS